MPERVHKRRLQVLAMVVGISLIIVLLLPFKEVVVAPRWKLRVVNDSGAPQSNVQVRQTWQDYSFGGSDEETRFSDSEGYVTFEKVSFRVNVLSIILATLRDSVRSLNPHASAGHYCSIFCLNAECETLMYKGSGSPPEELVVSRR